MGLILGSRGPRGTARGTPHESPGGYHVGYPWGVTGFFNGPREPPAAHVSDLGGFRRLDNVNNANNLNNLNTLNDVNEPLEAPPDTIKRTTLDSPPKTAQSLRHVPNASEL